MQCSLVGSHMSGNEKFIWPELSSIHTVIFDFDGVFTNNKVYLDQNGVESVRCDRADGLGLDMLRCVINRMRLNLDMFILSKEPNPVVLKRAAKLKLDCHHGISNKYDYLKTYFREKKPDNKKPFNGLIYLGNDLNDYQVMKNSAIAVAPLDADVRILEISSIVMERKGGDGFVRCFIELFITKNFNNEVVNECLYSKG